MPRTPDDRLFLLVDTFNGRIVSRHRTEEAADNANRKLQKAIKRGNGLGAYLPTVVAAPCAFGPGVRERNMPRAIGYGTHAPAHLVVNGDFRPLTDADCRAFDVEPGARRSW